MSEVSLHVHLHISPREAAHRIIAFIRASVHHEYDFLQGNGAFPSGNRRTAPMPWGEIVLLMNMYILAGVNSLILAAA